MTQTKRIRWRSFSLRSLLLFTTIVALGLGWYRYRAGQWEKITRWRTSIESAGGGAVIHERIFEYRILGNSKGRFFSALALPRFHRVNLQTGKRNIVPPEFVAAAPEADSVSMSGFGFDDATIDRCLSPSTQTAALIATRITPEGLTPLRRCRNLKTFALMEHRRWGTPTNSPGLATAIFAACSDHRQLEKLSLDPPRAELAKVPAGPPLSCQHVELRLRPTRKNFRDPDVEDSFAWLDRLPQLERLDIHGLDDVALQQIAERSPGLSHLTILHSEFTAPGLRSLARASQLRHLTLYRCRLGKEGIAALADCESLETVTFHFKNPPDVAEIEALTNMPKIKTIGYSVGTGFGMKNVVLPARNEK